MGEIGYLSVTPNGTKLFLQLVNASHERASTVPTSNKGFEPRPQQGRSTESKKLLS